MDKVAYLGLPHCYKLTNGTVEAVVTTDMGPRIVRYAITGADNVLAELPDVTVTTALGDWKPLGGHRLWTAPEAKPRSYAPDSQSVAVVVEGERSIRLSAPVDPRVGIEKEMLVTLDAEGSGLRVEHKITNRSLWGIELSLWGLTIMRGGGVVVFPQEPYIAWEDYLLPARPLVLWHYTDLSDSRWTLGQQFLRLRSDAALSAPQKIGLLNKQGWAAYHVDGTLFLKRFPHEDGANYPDYGCNTETYTAGAFIEIESLSPLHHLEPDHSATHTERWSLFPDIQLGATDDELAQALAPLLAHTTPDAQV